MARGSLRRWETSIFVHAGAVGRGTAAHNIEGRAARCATLGRVCRHGVWPGVQRRASSGGDVHFGVAGAGGRFRLAQLVAADYRRVAVVGRAGCACLCDSCPEDTETRSDVESLALHGGMPFTKVVGAAVVRGVDSLM